jgi:hypothetical protein
MIEIEIPGVVRPWFEVGDTVWTLTFYRERRKSDCPLCKGTSRVQIVGSDEKAYCPRVGCHLGQVREESETLYASIWSGTVGKVSVSVTANSKDSDVIQIKMSAMLWETGVGSGTVWTEDKLFVTEAGAREAAVKAGAIDDGGKLRAQEFAARMGML